MYPMCLPDVLQQNQFPEKRISFQEGSDLLNLGSAVPNTSSNLTHSLFTLAKQCNNLKQPSVTNMSKITNSKSSYGLESSNQAQQGPSEYNTFSKVNPILKQIYTLNLCIIPAELCGCFCCWKEFCREDLLCQPLNMEPSRTNLGVFSC